MVASLPTQTPPPSQFFVEVVAEREREREREGGGGGEGNSRIEIGRASCRERV